MRLEGRHAVRRLGAWGVGTWSMLWMLGSDTVTQLDGMRARMIEMQKGLAALMVEPRPASQAAPQPAEP